MPRYTTQGDQSHRRVIARLYLLGGFFALCFGILAVRAIFFHIKDNDRLEKVAMRQYRTAVKESTKRGKIVDINGRELAINIEAPSVWADPRAIVNPEETAHTLAELFGANEEKVFSRLTSQRKFVWIKRWVEEEQLAQLKELDIAGVHIVKENKRSYPNGQLAASILGAVGLDSEPLGGVELSLNDFLVRKWESAAYKRDARGHLYLSPADTVAIRPPNVVELTIDKTIQYITESVLTKTMESTKGKSGTIVVVNPRNGDIMALANMPTFDPNHYSDYDLESWKNRAITDPYEPGSTFKVISVASALESGTVTPNDVFDCENGEITIGKDTLHDSKAHGKLSVHDIIRVSSNIGAYKISGTLGDERISEYIRNFGFGSKTGIRLNGESGGIVLPVRKWTEVHLATIAFGQGISVTPLQMAMAFSAIANGGELLRPHIVKRVIDDKGDVIFGSQREVRKRPISRDTGRMMTRMLQVVASEEGTGVLAASLEYPTAGKTGTAQKPSRHGGYMKDRYYASFVGFAPADDPRVVVYVGIDEPEGYYYGGQVAAPAFREVVEKTLKYLKVPSRRRLASGREKDVDPREAYVESHMPVAPRKLPEVPMIGDNAWRLPDFTGLTMKSVMESALGVPLEFRFMGSGIAVQQYPAPGSTVERGEECVVEFRSLL